MQFTSLHFPVFHRFEAVFATSAPSVSSNISFVSTIQTAFSLTTFFQLAVAISPSPRSGTGEGNSLLSLSNSRLDRARQGQATVIERKCQGTCG